MKKAITYYTRNYEGSSMFSTSCVDTEHTVMVEDKPPVKNGNLYYFIKNSFEYLVLLNENGKWYK